ncbi:hypothetical protein J4711_14435 [Staphylococcus epidermidis]|nr:hypothetical protein [Staphylococcus epidermidis]
MKPPASRAIFRARHRRPWFGEGQPVSITLEHVYTPGKPDYIMSIRSRADELTIYDLEINRGNCQHSHIQKVMLPVDMPFTLKFGQAKKCVCYATR